MGERGGMYVTRGIHCIDIEQYRLCQATASLGQGPFCSDPDLKLPGVP